jgi:hypothetical protein
LTAPHLISATAFVVTPRPERYIKQLVSHFGSKVRTELTGEGGRLQFDFRVCDLKTAPTGIELIGTAEDTAQLETLKDASCPAVVGANASDSCLELRSLDVVDPPRRLQWTGTHQTRNRFVSRLPEDRCGNVVALQLGSRPTGF